MTEDDIARMAREAWKHDCFSLWQKHMLKSLVHFANLVAAAEREWVGLTDKEIEDCLEMSIQGTCRAIEAKLKEKNT